MDEKPPPGTARNHLAQAHMDFIKEIGYAVGERPNDFRMSGRYWQWNLHCFQKNKFCLLPKKNILNKQSTQNNKCISLLFWVLCVYVQCGKNATWKAYAWLFCLNWRERRLVCTKPHQSTFFFLFLWINIFTILIVKIRTNKE